MSTRASSAAGRAVLPNTSAKQRRAAARSAAAADSYTPRGGMLFLVGAGLLLAALFTPPQSGPLTRDTEIARLRLDPNTASAAELMLLKGVGPATAQRIVQARGAAPIRQEDDLDAIPSIGPGKISRMRPGLILPGLGAPDRESSTQGTRETSAGREPRDQASRRGNAAAADSPGREAPDESSR